MSTWRLKQSVKGFPHWTGSSRPRLLINLSLALRAPSQQQGFSNTSLRLVFLPFSTTSLNRLSNIQQHLRMDTQELKHFLADSPPSAVKLVIKKHFEALDDQQKRYAHYISRYGMPYYQSIEDFLSRNSGGTNSVRSADIL